MNELFSLNRWTEIHNAVFNNDLEKLIRLLEEDRCDINATDINGMTALHHAVFDSHSALVRLLLLHGADLSIKDIKLHTALDIAYEEGRNKEDCYRNIISLLTRKVSCNSLPESSCIKKN